MQKKQLVLNLLVLLLVGLMVGASQLLGEPEIIFPEITALAVGAWLAPRQPWRVSRPMMFLLITAFSVLGVLLNLYLPVPLMFRVLLAFFICQAALTLCGTTFAPLISAAILPVLLSTRSWVYPLSSSAMTLLIVAGQFLMEKSGMRAPQERAVPIPLRQRIGLQQLTGWLKLLGCASLVIVPALCLGANFCIAPPLLVGFTELANPESPARKRPGVLVLLVFACALAGSTSRLVFTQTLGLPLTVSALIATALALTLMQGLKFYFPPAGAVAVLPFLLPSSILWMYPIQAGLGFIALTGIALGLFRPAADYAASRRQVSE